MVFPLDGYLYQILGSKSTTIFGTFLAVPPKAVRIKISPANAGLIN
jgi:hypothetical protein